MITLDQAMTVVKQTKSELRSGQLLIGLYRFGGAGDTIVLGGIANVLKREFPDSHIQAHIRSHRSILDTFSSIDSIVEWNGDAWWQQDVLTLNKEYDLFVDCRYATKIFCNKKTLKQHPLMKRHNKAFPKYKWYYDEWLKSNTRLHELKMHFLDIINKSSGLNVTPSDWKIPPIFDDTVLQIVKNDYITVHNWADGGRQTKCWMNDKFSEVCKTIAGAGFKVYQLGGAGEEWIDGAESLLGKLSWRQTATVLKYSSLHIDIEGGLVYIARSHDTPSIVLFGATPIECFGWKENINISSNECAPCWWLTENWNRKCAQGHITPLCMDSITSDMVVEAAQKILKVKMKVIRKSVEGYEKQYELDAENLILDDAHYESEPYQKERIQKMVAYAKGNCLEIGAGDGYMMNLISKKGNPVDGCEISQTRIDRAKKNYGMTVRKADIRKLPYSKNKFDTVYCGEVLEHLPSIAEGFAELERVCKKDGQIVISLPIGEEHDKYYLHLWSIRMELVEVPNMPQRNMMVLRMKRINR